MLMPQENNNSAEMPHFRVKKMRTMWHHTAYNLLMKRERFVKSHHVVYTFVAGVGLIMFWYGIWEGLKRVPFFGDPIVAILLGALILLVCGAYAYQFVGNKALEFREELEDVTDDIDHVVEILEEEA
ncbi:hypothetical protein COY06_02830 [Candidatus Peregrinibacteria bacterium CG_4_10_14_0_2_um_filter_41_8]|nr:MAG: hypothetical protein COY06_02830 [Candidatus Peregrinibacteria bacterium CG_4_10_14_0_2_um_filter_41_8]